ncbi:glycine receptor subunit alphaZ1-like isoform X2 [Lineus longissimus]|uniref:glycine receptor subunit alphaZ1-like isoform X2 n=1 Tax=Lineus longissimus TaxID=88925 RepID=UPI00315D0B86
MQSKMDYAVFRTGIILGIIGFWAVQTGGEVEQETDMYSRQQSKLLNQLINESRYDSRLRPNLDGRPIVVICDFYVASFGELDEIAMDYSVDIFFRQSWNDPRLKHTGINGDNKTLALPAKMLDKIWIPDSFFSNEKMARGHDITVPNKLIRIYSTGNVMFSNRLTLLLSCHMALNNFPHDRQRCNMDIESFGYDDTDIVFKWKAEKAVELNPDLELPQFELDDDIELTENCERRYTTGNFSCLRSTFKLARKFGFFLLQTYIPSVLIVILSWVSFWIHPDAVPARISLGVTTVLTMTTQLSGSRASIPKVSYPKAIDVWMATCMLFVFSALIEYALVNVLSRQISKRIARRLATLAEPPAEPATDPLDSDDAKEIDERQGVEKNTMKPNSNANKGDKAAEKPSTMETCYRSFFRLIDCPVGPGNRNLSSSIDKSSRYGFPLSFLLFNIVYWSVYSSYSPE